MDPIPTPAGAKSALRLRLRTLRRSLGPRQVAAAGEAIARLAAGIGALAGARTVIGYLAGDGEPPIDRLLDDAARRGATVLLPRLRADGALDLVLPAADALRAALARPHPDGDPPPGFARGRGAILEPVGEAVAPGRLATPGIVLVPAVALDRDGHRLGRGGGAYDRLLAALPRPAWSAIGVCHDCQVVDAVPREPHDVALDGVLTDAGFAAARARPR